MPFTIKYTLNLKAAGHDGACPSIIQPLSVSPVIVSSIIMTANHLSRSDWTGSLKRPWKRKLGSPSYHKSPVGACYITWDMHMDKPKEALKGILKIISRVHDNRSKPTPRHDGEAAAKNCQNNRHTCRWIIISICWKSRASTDGVRTSEILQVYGLFFPDGWRAAKSPSSLHSKVWLHYVYAINTNRNATGIHQHGLPLEFTSYSMTHFVANFRER
jgi:hypothetical protein